jgi:hypothetical protein
MDERRAKKGDVVIYRSQSGDDVEGVISELSKDEVATLDLADGKRVSGIERNTAGAAGAFVNSWWLAEQFVVPTIEEGPIFLEALAAGLIVMLMDAADGQFTLDANGLPAALQAFKRGVGLVLAPRSE